MAQTRKPANFAAGGPSVDGLALVNENNNQPSVPHTAEAVLDVNVIVAGFADAVEKVVAEHRANGRAVYSVDADNKIKPS